MYVTYRDLVITDGDEAYNSAAEVVALMAAAAPGAFYKIWQRTVPAQVAEAWGQGSEIYPYNQGRLAFAAATAAANTFVDGTLQLYVANAPGTQRQYVFDVASSRAHLSAISAGSGSDASEALPISFFDAALLPEKEPQALQDSRLELWWQPFAATDPTRVAFRLPATIYS